MRIKTLPPLPIDDMEQREARLNERAAVELEHFILAEYEHRRVAPQYAGDILVSPSLVELNKMRPRRAWIPDVPDEEQ